MRIYFIYGILLSTAVAVLGAPPSLGNYIVTLKSGFAKSSQLSKLKSAYGISSTIEWDNAIHGFAARLDNSAVQALRAQPDVLSIEEDAIITIDEIVPPASLLPRAVQASAPWSLQRISQRQKYNDSAQLGYRYVATGAKSDIYVVDTGIDVTLGDFGGRAVWGATFGNYSSTDGNGHGTALADAAGGTLYGVAKGVKLIAVKVLSDAGSGTTSDIISGLNWISNQATVTKRPSVVILAIGGSANTALDNAVTSLVNKGIYVVVSAGSSATYVSSTSPARVEGAITVAGSTINDAWTSYSNYGPGLDIIAPASGTTYTKGGTLVTTIAATAYVAGLVAYLIDIYGSAPLTTLCTRNAISGVPSGTPNCLAYNGYE